MLLVHRGRMRRRPQRHGHARMLLLVAVLVLLLAGGAGVAGTIALSNCSLAKLRPISLGQNSFLYAADGSQLGSVPSSTNRQPLGLWAISPWLAKGTIAIEDHRFYDHGGVDYLAIVRAAIADVRAGRIVEGGSTITQQLVRNLYIGHPRETLSRKIEEACLANKLSQKLTKGQILAAYLNEVFYGRHAYGAEAGAETYFSRRARSLTLPQAALLAGLPQAPTVYDPITYPQQALARRNEVLGAMLANRDIDYAQYAWAVRTPLGLHPGTLYSDIRHPNFFGYAEQQLLKLYGHRRVEAGGLHVVTTIEPRLQAAALQAMSSHLPRRDDPASALVAIDPSSGAIRAMQSYLPDGRKLQFNLATQSGRQAGSSFKPFVLATALNEGISLYTYFSGPPAITIPDPKCMSGYNVYWSPHNFADESAGTMNLIDATAHSVNTIFAQLVDKVGPSNVVTLAHRAGIRSPLKAVCSITLGTQAVNPLEMTDAYASFASRGIHHPPQALALVRGPLGVVLGRLRTKGARAMPQSTADLVSYVLQRVVQRGTGTAAALDRPVAGKTGTAENFVDAWFCGYVPQLATCVWVGYPGREIPLQNVEGISGVVGGTIPAEIWHDFMTRALARVPVRDFLQPTSIPSSSGYSVSYPDSYSSSSSSAGASETRSTPETTTTTVARAPQPPPPRPVFAAPKRPVQQTTTTAAPPPTTTAPPPPPPPPPTTTTPPPPPPPTTTAPAPPPPPDATPPAQPQDQNPGY
jgi:penicillin-binding protein 1A